MKRHTLAAALALALTLPLAAPAAIQLDPRGCVAYGVWSRDLVWARGMGASRAKVRASLVELREAEAADARLYTLLLRDFDRLWASRAPRQSIMESVARDCYLRGGRYGDET